MRRIISIIVIICVLGLSFAFLPKSTDEEKISINWLTFEEAIEMSKKQPKPIFVDVYTHWCGWCKKMDKDTFENPKVVAYMNKNYYCIKFNAEGKENVVFPQKTYTNTGRNHELAVELLEGKMSYPSVVYLDKTFAKIQVLPGYRAADEFVKISKFMGEEIYKKQSWEDFSAGYTE